MSNYQPGDVQINMNLVGDSQDLPIYCRLDNGQETIGYRETPERTIFLFNEYVPSPFGATIYWNDKGYGRLTIPPPGQWEASYPPVSLTDMDLNPIDHITLQGQIPSFTREEVCTAQVTLSGLMIATEQFGNKPWFELAYQCLSNPTDRQTVRLQKKNYGDKGIIIEFFNDQRYIYPDRPGNSTWLGQCVTQVGEFNQELFKKFVEEILQDGLVPVVVYDGDNGENPTDGYPNALRQLPILTALLAEYNDKILYARFWDGVFYGTTPEQIKNFGVEFRKLLPLGNLAIEFNPGHIPVGNGPSDYAPGGMMTDYDVVVGEFNYPNYREDSTWQVVARLVPNYNRPSDQPSRDDPNPPFYLAPGNARGQYFFWAMEVGEYQWVRDPSILQELINTGNYFRGMNATNVGLPK